MICKMGQKNGFAREDAFANIEEFAHNPIFRSGSITHPGFICYSVFHIVHGAGFGYYSFTGIQFNLHDLHPHS